jgi:guanylate kinase
MRKGRIIVISAPSGSGKTTLCKRLLEDDKNLVVSTSVTTRPLRRGEENKRDYIFICEKKFRDYRRRGMLLEWAEVFGRFYGTPKGFVDEKLAAGKDVLLVIDVQGAFKVKRIRPSAVLIFIRPPSLAELKKRLLGRKSDGPVQIKLRLKIAKREIAMAKRYDHVVVNDDFNRALAGLKKIIRSYRTKGVGK